MNLGLRSVESICNIGSVCIQYCSSGTYSLNFPFKSSAVFLYLPFCISISNHSCLPSPFLHFQDIIYSSMLSFSPFVFMRALMFLLFNSFSLFKRVRFRQASVMSLFIVLLAFSLGNVYIQLGILTKVAIMRFRKSSVDKSTTRFLIISMMDAPFPGPFRLYYVIIFYLSIRGGRLRGMVF